MSIVSYHDFYPDDVVRTDPQILSDGQKQQARANIGAASKDDIGGGGLTPEQAQKLEEIDNKLDRDQLQGAINQALTEAQQSGLFDGQDGLTPQLSIGTVTTLEPGAQATASITGSTEALKLNLGIPKGASGKNGDGSITTKMLEDECVIGSKISASVFDEDYYNPYLSVTYVTGTISDDGSVNSGGVARVTNLLPVVPTETLCLNKDLTAKVAFYGKEGKFISMEKTTLQGVGEYVVPENAFFARYENEYNGGNVTVFNIRKKKTPKNKTFADVILSPIKTICNIGVTGDSNTIGYGLGSGEKPWANLMMDELKKITKLYFYNDSKYTETIGAFAYGKNNYNFRVNSEFSIWTDAKTIELKFGQNYDSDFLWLVDGAEKEGSNKQLTITTDGDFHKYTVKFTAGQMVGPYFIIDKTINYENTAEFGTGVLNVPVPQGKDWLVIMIGTNSIKKDAFLLPFSLREYANKGTYVVPFPNHKVEPDTVPQAQAYGRLINTFKSNGFEIINCSSNCAYGFYDGTLYSKDKIHFNAKGHRMICNMVSGKIGLPVMLWDDASEI